MPASAPTVGKLERILSLKRLPILSGLSHEDLAAVAEHSRERFFPEGDVLLREGDPVPALYAVLDGFVHVSRRGRTMGHVGAGGLVGGMGLFARDNVGMESRADRDTLTLELETDAVLEIFEDHFAILQHVLREVCRYLIDLVGRLPPRFYRDIFPPWPSADLPRGDLDLVERILFLRRVPLFAHTSINALAELSRGMAEVSFPAGTRLWAEGETSGAVLLVVSGTVAATARGGQASFTAPPGAPLGHVESIAERPHWYGAVAETRVSALQGSIEGLIDVFEDNFEIAMDYLETMSRAHLRLVELRISEADRSRKQRGPRAGSPTG